MNGDSGKALLAQMFRQIVQFKMRDDFQGGGYSPGAGGGTPHKSGLDRIEDELGGMGGGAEMMMM